MTHDEVVAEIQARAKRRGVLSHYCKRSVTCDGDRGMPDLVLVGYCHVAFVEVKMPGDTRRPDQVTWYHAIRASGSLYETMGPADLDNGTVDLFLEHVAEG